MTSAIPGLRVLSPGPKTTIQDTGRTGYRRHGLAAGGAVDLHAYAWANKLLDNPFNAACAEIVMGGFRAVAEGDVTIAIAGANSPVSINGRPVGSWQSHQLKSGDELDIGYTRSGRFLYLAMAGGIDSAIRFGSRSIVVREKLDGSEPLREGEILRRLAPSPEQSSDIRQVPERFRGQYDDTLTLRLIPGYQIDSFSQDQLLRLTTSSYTISEQSDRMGFRLDGTPMADVPPGIVSEGIAIGAVQVPGDGLPIALLNDCQTIGGYPKPGVIAALDCGRLAQRLPGQTVRFRFADIADIQNERRLFHLHFVRTNWDESGNALHWTL
ncbi:biotin-dependent carboxyltransferase family protein [Marinobacter sp. 71-i]|uniref:Biotin-dependent carboxyltransferase family protein n=1 Tax=Marinobacter iranensis TaxID=2962607 RepID=A0ABT5Y9N5_9GAMM|nr:biotin-dependent carboxyltransferase family protein [Marinobacter iranensis]MDF0750266.1 biotin-dependent carboxyltransferase family protein [Marinobacter iranensis]